MVKLSFLGRLGTILCWIWNLELHTSVVERVWLQQPTANFIKTLMQTKMHTAHGKQRS